MGRHSLRLASVTAFLILLVTLAACWTRRNNYTLYYGDAASHLNISRALIDSKTPGYDQLGTVWLPALHLLCLPFVGNDFLWSTGLAGTLPVSICFVIAGVCFYLGACELYQSTTAAVVTVACFALNPNILYLAVIPMTEIVFAAGLSFLFLALLKFRATQHRRWIFAAIFASWFTSLTRYDGWFLIPFIALGFASVATRRKPGVFLSFAVAASLASLYWAAHNWWETGNPLDFYNGPYSAAAVQGAATYPGYHDWLAAAHYYLTAAELCTGLPLFLIALAGLWFARKQSVLSPLLFLSLTPIFYVWSVHSSKLPIHVPTLWPFTYYNTRYGTALIPLCAFAAGALASALPAARKNFAFCIPLVAIAPWLLHPSKQNWICWKESEVNSVDRRAWTEAAAHFLEAHYQPSQGILTSTGDVTGIYCRARIHLSETLNIGNGPLWTAATSRPDLFHPSRYAILQQDDALAQSLARSPAPAPYAKVLSISTTQYSPVLHILTRTAQHDRNSLH